MNLNADFQKSVVQAKEYLLAKARGLVFVFSNVLAALLIGMALIAFWVTWDVVHKLRDTGRSEHSYQTRHKYGEWSFSNLPARDGQAPGFSFGPSFESGGSIVLPTKTRRLDAIVVALVGVFFFSAAIFMANYGRRRKVARFGLAAFVVSGWLTLAIYIVEVGDIFTSGKDFLAVSALVLTLVLATFGLKRMVSHGEQKIRTT